jgi:hypothetical protein
MKGFRCGAEHNTELRQDWLHKLGELEALQLLFMDESAANEHTGVCRTTSRTLVNFANLLCRWIHGQGGVFSMSAKSLLIVMGQVKVKVICAGIILKNTLSTKLPNTI